MKKTIKRGISWLLLFSMILGLMPAISLQADAASNIVGTFEGQDADVFTALGFDTTEIPEGYDADTTENPTGRDKSTGTQVYEAVLDNYSGTRIWGHNDNNVDPGNLYAGGDKGPKYRMSAVAAGDFDGDGLAGELVYVGFPTLPSYSSGRSALYMGVANTSGDTLAGYSERQLAAEIGPHTVNSGDGMSRYDWAWQNLLQVSTGDYDGDGTSEIAVYIAESGSPRVEIYKYQRTSQSTANDWEKIANWSRVWSYALDGSKGAPNMVSLASGDFDRDGVDDLAIASGRVVIKDTNMADPTKEMEIIDLQASKAVVLWGDKAKMLQRSSGLDLNEAELGEQVRVSLTAGDLDGDGNRELIATGQSLSELRNYRGSALGLFQSAEGNKTRTITTYLYDSASGLVINSSETYAPVEGEFVTTTTTVLEMDGDELKEVEKTTTSWNGNGFDGFYHSAPLMKTNAAVFKPEGADYTYLYLDSCLYEYNQGALSLKSSLDDSKYDMENTLGGDGYWGSDNQGHSDGYYVEYGAVSEDMWGRGNQVLMIGTYASGSRERPNSALGTEYSGHKYGYGILYGSGSGRLQTNVELNTANNTNGIRAYSMTFANTDIDTVIMEYSGIHYLTYSDPKVLAIIAAAPYFEDVDIISDYDYAWQNTTSYSTISGTGDGDHVAVDLEFGLYAYSEVTASMGMINQELSANFTLEWSEETMDMEEYTLSFETSQDEDAVAFFSIPTENYIYNIYTPTADGKGWVKTTETVSRDFTPCYQVLNLDYYESIRGNYDDLPPIRGEAIESTPGDPASYPSSTSGYEVISEWKDYPAGVSFGNGAITQEITVTKEETTSFNMGAALDFKYGGGLNAQSDIGQAQAQIGGGFQFSMNPSGGWTKINLEGTTIAGTVTNMPLEFQDYGYYYSWKLFSYEYELSEDNIIPVISYVVGDVSEPPRLPRDFQQDFDRSTSESNFLTWSYDGTFSKFYIYKYFDFPVGGGLQLVETIDASTPNYTVKYDENGKPYKEYFFEDTNLAAYTEYQYAIQVERLNVTPPLSAPSGLMTARTKAAEGYPRTPILESDGENDGYLLVYPDKTATLTVDTTGPEGENPNNYYSVVQYQWQKLEKTGWTDLVNETKATLSFAEAGVESQGSYRCRVNVLTKADNTGITAYTNPVELVHSKRTSYFEVLEARDISGGIELYAEVANGHNDSGAIPSGTVTFTLTSNSTGKTYQTFVDLNAAGVAQKLVTQMLPEGMYTLDAYYSGSYIFTACAEDALYLSQRSSGYDVDILSTVTYGDGATADFRMATKVNGLTETENVDAPFAGVYRAAPLQENWNDATAITVGDAVTKNTWYAVTNEMGTELKFQAPVDGKLQELNSGYALIDQDGVLDNATGIKDGLTEGDFTGRFHLSAQLPAGTYAVRMQAAADVEAVIGLTTISPRRITLQLGDYSIGEGESAPKIARKDATVVSGSWAPHDLANSSFMGQQFSVLYYNTAGVSFNNNTVNDTCGAYAIRPTSGIDNYDVIYRDGFLAVLGATHTVSFGVRDFEGQYVGTLYAMSPEYGSTRKSYSSGLKQEHATGTRLVLQAAPDDGYEVYDWYINGVAQGTTATSIAYVTLNEDTRIEVQYTVKQHTLTYGTAGDTNGGTIVCNDADLASGSVVLPNALFTFTAQAAEGYHFKEWRYNEVGKGTVYNNEDAGAMTSTFDLQMPDASCSVYAVFERDFYTVSYEDLTGSGGLTAWYMGYPTSDTTGQPEKITLTSGTKIKGDSVIYIQAKPGYYFDTEYNWVSQGSQGTAGQDVYTLTLTEDTLVTGYTVRDSYDVDVSVQVLPPEVGAIPVTLPTGTYANYDVPFQQPVGATVSYTYENVSGSHAYDDGERFQMTSNKPYYTKSLTAVPGGTNITLRIDLPNYYEIIGWASDATRVETTTEENRLATYVALGDTVEAGKAYYFKGTTADGNQYFVAPATGELDYDPIVETGENGTPVRTGYKAVVYVPGESYAVTELAAQDNIRVRIQEKNVYQVDIADISQYGTYTFNAAAGEFALPEGAQLVETEQEGIAHSVKVHSGDALTVLVTPKSAYTVTYWQCKPATGSVVQSRATSLKYTIPDIQENYTFTPVFSSSTYLNITWPNINETENRLELVPLDGNLVNVASGSGFSFKLQGDGLTFIEAVMANGVAFQSGKTVSGDGATLNYSDYTYKLTKITKHQVISVKLKDVGVTVDGVDVSRGSGNGWTYDRLTSTLTLTRSGLTLSGTNVAADPADSSPFFRIIAKEQAAEIKLQDLYLENDPSLDQRMIVLEPDSDAVQLSLKGENVIRIKDDAENYVEYNDRIIHTQDDLILNGDGSLSLERDIRSDYWSAQLIHTGDLHVLGTVQLMLRADVRDFNGGRDIHTDNPSGVLIDAYDVFIGQEGAETGPVVRLYSEGDNISCITADELYMRSGELIAETLGRNATLRVSDVHTYGGRMELTSRFDDIGTASGSVLRAQKSVSNTLVAPEWYAYYPDGYTMLTETGTESYDEDFASTLAVRQVSPDTYTDYFIAHGEPEGKRSVIYDGTSENYTCYQHVIIAPMGAEVEVPAGSDPYVTLTVTHPVTGRSYSTTVKERDLDLDAHKYYFHLTDLDEDGEPTETSALICLSDQERFEWNESLAWEDRDKGYETDRAIAEFTSSYGEPVLTLGNDIDDNREERQEWHYTLQGNLEAYVLEAQDPQIQSLHLNSMTIGFLVLQQPIADQVYVEGENYIVGGAIQINDSTEKTLTLISQTHTGSLYMTDVTGSQSLKKLTLENVREFSLTGDPENRDHSVLGGYDATLPITYRYADENVQAELPYGTGWQIDGGDSAATASKLTGYEQLDTGKYNYVRICSKDIPTSVQPEILYYNKDAVDQSILNAAIQLPLQSGQLYGASGVATAYLVQGPYNTEHFLFHASDENEAFRQTGVQLMLDLSQDVKLEDYKYETTTINSPYDGKTPSEVLAALPNGNYTIRIYFEDPVLGIPQYKETLDIPLKVVDRAGLLDVTASADGVTRGDSLTLTASPYGTAPDNYIWSVPEDSGVTVTPIGDGSQALVTAAPDTKANQVTVTITSRQGDTVLGETTYTVKIIPTAVDLTIACVGETPSGDGSFILRRGEDAGKTWTFQAKAVMDNGNVVSGADTTWSLWGAQRAATKVDPDTGVLTIDTKETGTNGLMKLTATYTNPDGSVLTKVAYLHLSSDARVAYDATVTEGGAIVSAVYDGNAAIEAEGMWIPAGSTVTVTAEPAEGFLVDAWTVNGKNVMADPAYIVEGNTLTFATEATGQYDVAASFVNSARYAITFTAGENGTLTARSAGAELTSGDKLPHNADVTFTAAANDLYQVGSWTVDGAVYMTNETVFTGDTVTLTDIKADHDVQVAFTLRPVTITLRTASEDGTLSLLVNGQPVSVEPENGIYTYQAKATDSVTILASPEVGYTVSGWALKSGDAYQDLTNSAGQTTYQVNSLRQDLDLQVTFAPLDNYDVTVYTNSYENGFGTVTDGIQTVPMSSSGVISVSKHSDLTLTAQPDEGSYLYRWEVEGADYTQNGNTLTLLNVEADATVKALFRRTQHTVTLETAENGTLTGIYSLTLGEDTFDGTLHAGANKVRSGSRVDLLAAPAEGYTLAGMTVNGQPVEASWSVADNAYCYTVDALTADVTVTATFVGSEAQTHSVTVKTSYGLSSGDGAAMLTGSATIEAISDGVSGGVTTENGKKTVQIADGGSAVLRFKPENPDYVVDLAALQASIQAVLTDSGSQAQVTYTAAPVTVQEKTVNGYDVTLTGIDMILDFSGMDDPFVRATEETTYTVTIQKPANGTLEVTWNGMAIQSGTRVPADAVLTITATPADHYQLTAVTNGDTAVEDGTLTVTADVDLQAAFTASEYPLTVKITGTGTVTINGETWTDGQIQYLPVGSQITVAYTYDDTQMQLTTSHGANTYTLDAAMTISAKFTARMATVTYQQPDNGSLTLYQGNQVVESGAQIPVGTTLTVVTTPAEHYQLDTLTADGSPISGDSYIVKAGKDNAIAATFARFELSVTWTDTDGVITVVTMPDGDPVTSGQYVPVDTNLKITAKPNTGFQLTGISVEGAAQDPDTGWYTVRQDTAIEALYKSDTPAATETFKVDIGTVGKGTLTVTADGKPVTDGDKVPAGTVLTITATPAEHYKLTSLTNGDVEVVGDQITVNRYVNLVATFEISEYKVDLQIAGPGAVLLNGTKYTRSQAVYLPMDSEVTVAYEYDSTSVNLSTTCAAGTYTLDKDLTIDAKFSTGFTSVYFNQPANGTLTVFDGEKQLASGASVAIGTILTVKAQPDDHYKLATLTGGGTAITDGTYQVKGGVDNTITGSFQRSEVSVTWTDTNGVLQVKQMPGDTAVTSGQYVPVGATLAITATANDGYTLKDITVRGAKLDAATGLYTATADTTITANYEVVVPPTTYMVEVELLGEGTVTVTANGAPLTSGDRVETGTVLTIQATPAEGAELITFEVNGVSFQNGDSYQVYANTHIKVVFDDSGVAGGLPYYMNEAGKRTFIGFSFDMDGSGYIDRDEYIAPSGTQVLFAENPKTFTDIARHWGEESILFVTEREIFNGTGNGKFSPEMPLDRAMFVTVIGRLYERSYGTIPAASGAFTDCNYNAYYGKYVDWAQSNGIINGYGNGRFGPTDLITREQMAVILYNFASFLGKLPSDMDASLSYPDAGSISKWAVDGARFCQTTGLIKGVSDGSFAPKQNTKRVEMAVVTMRLIEYILK